jgi:hypothetical protein
MLREPILDGRWQGRLVNGSDYPLPGSPVLTPITRLVDLGLLSSEASEEIAHIQGHNPLLFDFALKRLIRIDGHSFGPNVFPGAALFPGRRSPSVTRAIGSSATRAIARRRVNRRRAKKPSRRYRCRVRFRSYSEASTRSSRWRTCAAISPTSGRPTSCAAGRT